MLSSLNAPGTQRLVLRSLPSQLAAACRHHHYHLLPITLSTCINDNFRRHHSTAPNKGYSNHEPQGQLETKDTSHGRNAKKSRDAGRARRVRPPSYLESHKLIAYHEWGFLRNQIPEDQHHVASRTFTCWKNAILAVRRGWEVDSVLLSDTDTGCSDADSDLIDALLACHDVDEMVLLWQRLDSENSIAALPRVLISLLACDSATAALFVEAICQTSPPPPGFYLTDALRYLLDLNKNVEALDAVNRHPYISVSEESRTQTGEAMADLVVHVLRLCPPRHLPFSQNDIFSIQKDLSVEKTHDLYCALVDVKQHLHTHTLMHFASKFAADPHYKDTAMQIALDMLSTDDSNVNHGKWAPVLTTLFSTPNNDHVSQHTAANPRHHVSADEIWRAMMSKDHIPNLITATAFIRNLCRAGLVETALRIVEILSENNIKSDPTLYSTLLDGCRWAPNTDPVGPALAMAIQDGQDTDVIWNNVLHLISHFAVEESRTKFTHPPWPVPAFLPMLRVYTRVFDPEPLQEILPVDLESYLSDPAISRTLDGWEFPHTLASTILEFSPSNHSVTYPPTQATLHHMVVAYVKSLSNPYDILSFYSHFRTLLLKGEKEATTLVRENGSFVHDTIIKALAEHPGFLRAALDIVSDMMQDAPNPSPNPASPPPNNTNTQAPQSPEPLRPSIYTWNILLDAWLRQSHSPSTSSSSSTPTETQTPTGSASVSGNRILSLMKKNNVPPDSTTWNILIARHADAQDPDGAFEAIRGRLDAGFEPDQWTLRGLERLQNKEELLRRISGRGLEDRLEDDGSEQLERLDGIWKG